ncbi:pickpocket protein 28-like [Zophobas morio]|uniref:pickpocket protein 28-like n=1 Tax=Zophobas morio TaxID=2755281 RepID=UPI0030833CF5
MHSSNKVGFWYKLRKYLREYSEITGIHGLRYVAEQRSRTEKIVWVFLLLFSLAGCLYMINEILQKYENSPVVVSFTTEDTPTYQIPFPAVTICPEMKYSREQFNYSEMYFRLYRGEKIEQEVQEKFFHLSLLCDMDGTSIVSRHANYTADEGLFKTFDEVKLDRAALLTYCHFNYAFKKCEDFFAPVIIDEGICYSFNILSGEEVFREHVFNYAEYYYVPNKSEDYFDLETGYKDNAGINTYPRRALMSGADNSLTVFFKYNLGDADFTCNGLFQGFRVLIHTPWDVPRLSKHHFHIPVGKVVVAAMEPEMIITSETVRKFKPERRKCFMQDERHLQHFKYYTQSNCLLECTTNYTLSRCGCVRFFMPRNNTTPICGSGSSICLRRAESELKGTQLKSKLSGHSFCNCQPSCTNLKFGVEISHSDFYFKDYFESHTNMTIIDNSSHWSVLQIYFKEEQFTTVERNELYGMSDLISNFGGLLGLFTGFSIVSLMEIIYFCTLRIFCNEKIYGIWSGRDE